MSCDDLRLGGTLSATGVANGVSINSTALTVADWSGILGNPGLAFTPFETTGRPGAWLVGDGLPRARFLNLNMTLTRWGAVGYALTEPTEAEQLWANTDVFLALLQAPQYLEVDLPDGTKRFLYVTSLDPSFIDQPRRMRNITVPLISAGPYWRAGGNQSTDTIASADTLVTAGTANVYDAVLVFAGTGTFTHSTLGWSLGFSTFPAGASSVTVDLGNRTVIDNFGNPADSNMDIRTSPFWGWFTPGNNSVTSNVSVVVTWRDSFA